MASGNSGDSPQQVLAQYYAAVNSGDADRALALFAPDATRVDTAVPDKVIKGKERIGAGIRARIADNIFVEAIDYQMDGETAICYAKVWTDYACRLGFAPVEEDVDVTVNQGLITRFAVTVRPESLARIRAAEAANR